MRSIYLDTETTGLKPETSRIVEIALVDDAGAVVLNTLVDPQGPIPPDAMAIHGITDAMTAGMPTLEELLPAVLALCRGREVVIYNAAYDTWFIPGITVAAAKISCCMLAAQKAMRVDRWPKLVAAAEWAGYVWTGGAHRALADTLAARHVWNVINSAKADVAIAGGEEKAAPPPRKRPLLENAKP